MWPLGTLRSILRLCSRVEDASAADLLYLSRFTFYCSHSPDLIRLLKGIIHDHRSHSSSGSSTVCTQKFSASRAIRWLVLPFHPVWYDVGLHQLVVRFINSVDSQQALSFAGISNVVFRLSGKNVLMPNMHVLSRRF
jgi:hypothetical protein